MKIYNLFAQILDPPGPSLLRLIDECLAILTPSRLDAAFLLNRFKTFVEQTPFSRIKEIYAEAFCLQGACYPYVGYHLFGDGSHRGMFLAGLEEHYRVYHFSASPELPDHLGVMLQFLTKDGNEEERDELVSLCMIPGLKRILEGCENNPTPYREIFQALLSLMREEEKIPMERMAPVIQEEFPSSE